LYFYNAAGTFISNSAGTVLTLAMNRVRQKEEAIAAPVGTASMRFVVTFTTTVVGSGAYAEIGFWHAKVENNTKATAWRDDAAFEIALADIVTAKADIITASNAASTANGSIATTNSTVAANFTALRTSNDGAYLPSTFEKDDLFWDTNASFVTESGIGRVFQATSGGHYIKTRGKIQVSPNRTYRITSRHRVKTNTTNGINPKPLTGIRGFDTAGATTGNGHWVGSFVQRTTSDGWVTVTGQFTTAEILTLQAEVVTIEAYAEPNWSDLGTSNAVTQIQFLKLEDVTDITTTNAAVTSAASAAATANSSIASLQTLVTSRIGQKPASLLVNPAFSDYPVASASIPPGWANWGNGLSSSRGAGRVGTYAHIQEGVAAQNSGLYQNRRMEPGKHNIDIAIERSAGTLTGGGVLIQYFNSSGTFISETRFPFASISDTRGGVGVSVGYDYRTFRLAFTAPANTYTANVYLMNHWTEFGDTSTYNQIYWHQVDVTPVDYGSATVDALATTVATVDGKLSASYALTVDAGGRIASMKLLSDGTTSSVKFVANTFQIFNGTTDEAPFEVVSGVVKIKSANVGTLNVGSGGVTIQSAAPGSARIVMSNSVIEVFDGSSVRRVRMGVW
jgi:hypothetical protein